MSDGVKFNYAVASEFVLVNRAIFRMKVFFGPVVKRSESRTVVKLFAFLAFGDIHYVSSVANFWVIDRAVREFTLSWSVSFERLS